MKTHPNSDYLVQLARRAGTIMSDKFTLGMAREVKGDNTPLTEADTSINDLVVQTIGRDYPHIKVIGEEGSGGGADSEFTILCDPVDGTIPFSRGVPLATFVISLLRNGVPIEAVVYDPFLDRMWRATKGEGTLLNDRPTRISNHKTIKRSNVCIVWWKGSLYNLRDACDILMERGAIWTNPATIAYYGGLLASGEYDATIFPGTNGWETGAMQLLAEEAGGKVTDIYGAPMAYGPGGEIKGHLITNGHVHDELLEILHTARVTKRIA